ncbi:MAG: thermonuclease family protein [Candidatus Gottesmanbacteria bacterium]|nr:thermonuclease family protein [Candidatus Gottesmanbacteria bacterium]
MTTKRISHASIILWTILIASLPLNILLFYQQYERTRVVSVPDGDSIQLVDGRRVRLLGIDAPEIGNCLADEAKQKLRSLVLSKHVRLKDTVTDDYGRVLASVFVNGQNINAMLLASGLAKNTYAIPSLKPIADEAKSSITCPHATITRRLLWTKRSAITGFARRRKLKPPDLPVPPGADNKKRNW